jgi:hypothetical protein
MFSSITSTPSYLESFRSPVGPKASPGVEERSWHITCTKRSEGALAPLAFRLPESPGSRGLRIGLKARPVFSPVVNGSFGHIQTLFKGAAISWHGSAISR